MQRDTEILLSYFERLEFGECAMFVGEQGRRARQLATDLNNGEIKAALHMTSSRRFRSFLDDRAMFIVRTR